MDVFLEALSNPADMSRQQWILVAIVIFVLVGAAYMLWRLYKLIVNSQKSTYVPNIGRKRLAMAREGKPHNTSGSAGYSDSNHGNNGNSSNTETR